MIKKNYILFFVFIFALAVIIIDSANNKVASNGTGAPAAHTGSPGDNYLTCTDCHTGPPETFGAGWIVSDVPPGGYVPGTTYTITATASLINHIKFGFQVSPQDGSGALLGTMMLINPSETKLINSGKYITHTAAGTSGGAGSKSWSFHWVAPSAGTGDVTFYGAFNITNNSLDETGDTIFVSTLLVSECQPPPQPISISGSTNVCPGSAQVYSVDSIADATSFVWTIPAGWSGTSNDTSITVTAGGSGGIISVHAINDCGTGTDQSLSISISSVTVSFSNVNNVSCAGGNNGTANAVPAGGNFPYTYTWNTIPVQHNATASGLSAGTYSVQVSDAAGCATTSQVTITQPLAISLSAGSLHSSCSGVNNGSADVSSVSGGVLPYTYSWNTIPVQNNDTAFNIGAGTYVVTVTDANSCTKTASTTVSTAPLINLSTSGTNVLCNGGNTGSATAIASGGTNPITYSWNTVPVQVTATATGITMGTYTVMVTDNNGCTKTSSIPITQPAAITATASHTNASCFGGNNGSATVVSSGGTGSHTYSWNTIPVQTTSTAVNLIAGTYIVTVTDANSCVKTASTVVTEPTQVSLQTNSTSAACSQSNGSATVIASGGNPVYTYLWNSIPVQTNSVANNISAGTYTVVVTDASSCTAQAFVTVSNNSGVTLSVATVTNVGCNGDSTGAASVDANGGAAPYVYSWSPGGNTTDTVFGLKAGFYNVSITDSNNCIASSIITITEPAPLVSSAGSDAIICEGDTVLLGDSPSAYGGTLPYSYQWLPATGLNYDSVSNPLAFPHSSTSYILVLIDSNSCISTSTINISVNPLPPVPVIINNNDTLFSSIFSNCQWYENGILINGADTGFFIPTHSANYSVSISDSNSCSVTSPDYSFVLSASNLTKSEDIFLIYPNPANNFLNIYTGNCKLDSSISILDLSGNVVLKSMALSGLIELNISKLQSGFYFLMMGNVVKVLMVEK